MTFKDYQKISGTFKDYLWVNTAVSSALLFADYSREYFALYELMNVCTALAMHAIGQYHQVDDVNRLFTSYFD